VALFERSGKDVKTFCRENELIPGNLWAWLRQMRAKAAGESTVSGWVEMTGGPHPVSPRVVAVETGMALRICFPCGTRVEVMAGAAAPWLAEVLRALPSAEV
jgi:hypothetical protein